MVSISLPESFAGYETTAVPYYISDGREIIIPVSSMVDGKLVFIAPASAVYYENKIRLILQMFKTTGLMKPFDFTATRGLFNGVGNGKFDPDGQMTRAMFITVIARLDGADLSGFISLRFTDVPAGS